MHGRNLVDLKILIDLHFGFVAIQHTDQKLRPFEGEYSEIAKIVRFLRCAGLSQVDVQYTEVYVYVSTLWLNYLHRFGAR